MSELPTIDAERPWPGLLPFTEDSRMFFHGRERETDDLFRLIERDALTVLFGQSGLGKSSLLNAGVFPRLRRAGYLPVYLRLNLDVTAPMLIEQVWDALIRECVDHEVSYTAILHGDRFWQYLHRPDTQFFNPHGRPIVPVLVFDQFEELFTLGRQTPEQAARTQTLLLELGELIENRMPPVLERELTQHPELLDQFDLLRQNVKMVFTLREDYLAEFESLKTLIRPIMQNRMRLEPMRGDRAARAIQHAGAAHLSEAVAARVVRFVGGAPREDAGAIEDILVEPALLSLVCRELNEQRIARRQREISADLIQGANAQEIFAQFYSQGFAGSDIKVRYFVEDRLLTAAGYRDSCALDNALAEPGVNESAIQTLVDRRILRREERGGLVRIELIHDVLAGVAKASRDARREAESLEAAQLLLAQDRRRLRIAGGWAAILVAALLGVSWLAVFAIRGQREALLAKNEANRQAALATSNAEEAKRLAALATSNSEEANRQALLAEEQRALAEAQGRIANERSVAIAEENIRQQGQLAGNLARNRPLEGVRTVLAAADASYRQFGRLAPDVQGALFDVFQLDREQLHIPIGGQVSALKVSRDGKEIVAGDGVVIRAWDEHGKLRYELGEFDIFRSAANSTDFRTSPGDLIAFDVNSSASILAVLCADGTIRIHRLSDGVKQKSWKADHGKVVSISASTDGNLVAKTADDGMVQVWDIEGNKQGLAFSGRKEQKKEPLVLTAFVGSGQVATIDSVGHLWLSNPGGGDPKQFNLGIENVDYAVVDENNSRIAIHGGDRVIVWEVKSQSQSHSVRTPRSILSLALHPDGTTVATSGLDGLIRLWGADGLPRSPLQADSSGVKALVFGESGNRIFGAGAGIRSWALDDFPAETDTRTTYTATSAAVSPQGDTIAVADSTGKLHLLNRRGKQLAEFDDSRKPNGATVNNLNAVAWSGDGSMLATAESDRPDHWISILQIGARGISRLNSFQEAVDAQSLAFTSDNLVAIAGAGPEIHLRTVQGAMAGELKTQHAAGIVALAVLPAPERLVTAGLDGFSEVWDLRTRKLLQRFRADPRRLTALASDIDSGTFLTGGEDGVVRRWNPADGKLVWETPAIGEKVAGVATFHSGLIIVGGQQGAVRLLRADGKPVSEPYRPARVIFSVATHPRSGPILLLTDNGHRQMLFRGLGDSWLEDLCSRISAHHDLQSERAVCDVTPQESLTDLVIDGSTPTLRRVLNSRSREIDTVNPEGRTPLMLAAKLGYSDMLSLLLDAGAHAQVKDRLGDTPLHAAARLDDAASVRALLRAGAAVNAANSSGQTPLLAAIESRSNAAIDVLLQSGADTAHQDASGKTAWTLAVELDEGHAMNSLIERHAATLLDLPEKYRRPDPSLQVLPTELPTPSNHWAAMGVASQRGEGRTKSPKASAEAYQHGVDEGDAMSMYLLARLIEAGGEVPFDPAKIRALMLRSANLGNPWAMNSIGYFYHFGVLAAADPERAVAWYRKAVAAGSQRAMQNFAMIVTSNPGLAVQGETASDVLAKAAAAGSASAQ